MARIEFSLTDDLVTRIRVEAATLNLSISAWAQRIFQAAFDAQLPAIPRTIPDQPKVAFLEQLEANYHISVAAEKAGVPLLDVPAWLEDPEFREMVAMAQESFVERLEADLIAIGRGTLKGNPLALMGFLNAHHPQWGIKGELMTRVMGDIIEQFYGVVCAEVGPELASAMKGTLKEVAEKKIVQFRG